MRISFYITDKMYEALIRAKERRKLYSLTDTVRVLLSEKLKEGEEEYASFTKECRKAREWEPQTQTQVAAEAPASPIL